MGSPEYPGDGNDHENNFEPPPSHNLPMHGINQSEDEDTEMPEEPFDPSQPYAAEGYHPLNFDMQSADDDDDDGSGDDSDDVESAATMDDLADRADAQLQQQPIETTAEREILQEVWNAPRSAEQTDIALDSAKAEQIKSVMTNVSLKLAGVVQPPEWALNVPESKWIEKLLEDVRSKKSK